MMSCIRSGMKESSIAGKKSSVYFYSMNGSFIAYEPPRSIVMCSFTLLIIHFNIIHTKQVTVRKSVNQGVTQKKQPILLINGGLHVLQVLKLALSVLSITLS